MLADNFYVIAFDLPGFGRSDKNNALYSTTYGSSVSAAGASVLNC